MLFQCRPTVSVAGPTLKQHWVNTRFCWDYKSAVRTINHSEYINKGMFLLREGSLIHPSITSLIKAAPWEDINFRFYFRTEVVYPTDHVFFQNFYIFTNIFNQHFYKTRSNPNTLFVYLKDD